MANVPNVPGVPSLPSFSPNDAVLLLADVVSEIFGETSAQWGIFQDGAPVLTYDSQVSFSYSQDWKIATYPVEDGSFTSYDKVQMPSMIRCRFSAGASATNRQAMLDSIDAVMSTTETYDVVTPEEVYLSYNFTHREYDREAASVGLVVIDVWLMEVIQTATTQFQSTTSPADAGQVGLGNVAAPSTDAQTQSAISAQGIN